MTKRSKPPAKAIKELEKILEFAIYETRGFAPLPIILKAEDDAWSDTINKLVEMQVNRWRRSYRNPDIMDGCEWYLTVRSIELNIKSSGSNAYPPNFDCVREIIEHAAAITPAQS